MLSRTRPGAKPRSYGPINQSPPLILCLPQPSWTIQTAFTILTRDVPVTLYAVEDTSWSETAIVWANKPVSSIDPLSTATILDNTARFYDLNQRCARDPLCCRGHVLERNRDRMGQ